MEPRRSKVSTTLSWWMETAAADERRTVLVQVRPGTSVALADDYLAGIGVEVDPPVEGATVCTVTPAALRRMADQPWVQSIEAPTTRYPRADPPGA
jgi:hypothetical protein